MAIYINGIKVAGLGLNGTSPYQIAQAGGYTGTEEEFNLALISIGETRQGFDNFLNQMETAKTEVEQLLQDLEDAKENSIVATKEYVDNATAQIVTDIFYYGPSAPENTKLLWIDSDNISGGLKFYDTNTSTWIHVPVAWS